MDGADPEHPETIDYLSNVPDDLGEDIRKDLAKKSRDALKIKQRNDQEADAIRKQGFINYPGTGPKAEPEPEAWNPPVPPPANVVQPPPTELSPEELRAELESLKQLRDDGLITLDVHNEQMRAVFERNK